jgi:hypothetical protein
VAEAGQSAHPPLLSPSPNKSSSTRSPLVLVNSPWSPTSLVWAALAWSPPDPLSPGPDLLSQIGASPFFLLLVATRRRRFGLPCLVAGCPSRCGRLPLPSLTGIYALRARAVSLGSNHYAAHTPVVTVLMRRSRSASRTTVANSTLGAVSVIFVLLVGGLVCRGLLTFIELLSPWYVRLHVTLVAAVLGV